MSEVRPAARRGWAQILFVNVAILVALWLGALVVAAVSNDVAKLAHRLLPEEVDKRALLPNYPDHALAARIYADLGKVGKTYEPFLEWRARPVRTKTTNIDAQGHRFHSAGRDPDAATTVGFFGGSAMWGMGADDDNTIPGLFDQLTNGFAVTNYAQIAWTSRQNLEQLINLIHAGQAPKIVIMYEGYNDVTVNCNLAITRSTNGTAEEAHMREALDHRNTGGFYRTLVAPVIGAIEDLRGRSTPPDRYVCASQPERAKQVAETMARNWEIASRLVASYGGQFFGFLQPTAFVGRPRTDYMPPDVNRLWEFRDQAGPDARAVYPLMRAALTERKIHWTDLTDAFDGDGYYYVDSVHVSPNGNKIIAQRIANQLAAQMTMHQ